MKSPPAKRRRRSASRAHPAQRAPKRAEKVALQIIQDIVTERKREGDKLPNEVEMLGKYAVSRSSLREALRLLEVQGLVTIRSGPGSGTEVGRINPANLAGTLALYLMMDRAEMEQLLDAWGMVEPLLADLAARNADRDYVRALMEPFASGAAEGERAMQTGLDFHDAIAELSGNPVLGLVLGAVGALVTEQVRLRTSSFELSDATVHAHEAIARAVIAGDGPAAAEAMRDHLDEVRAELRAAMPDIGGALRPPGQAL
ncbi:FadR/GntR family transcriptional regulator [Aquibium microcysteis]|uniref:FadR/GntR family transcriptional regulator n=1 Tax=Aquibium microcysteis TaxID=675281 RepID=UPI00165D02D2|nr:FadR/GntR family transcriptional regulator [Aquibium microcysteis]